MKILLLAITLPLISAIIGWLTNVIAVRMLFRPRKAIRVAGITIQGLIPQRRADLARTIASTVEKELISHRDIHNVVSTPKFQQQILDTIITRIENFILTALGSSPFAALILAGETAARIKQLIRDELGRMLPDITEELFEKVEANLDFKEIIREKIESFDLSRLEAIVYSITARELKAIELIGGLLGLVIGLVQVLIIIVLQAA